MNEVLMKYLPLVLHLAGKLPTLVAQAQAAFSGQPGSGAQKKQLVEDGLQEVLDDLKVLAPNLLTADQETAIKATVMLMADGVVSALNTAKLFQPAAIPPKPVA